MAKLTPERRKQMEEERGEAVICHCCGYAAEVLAEYQGPITHEAPGGKGQFLFCDICAGTFLSHCITYPRLYGSERHLWASIGWIGNHLASLIRRRETGRG